MSFTDRFAILPPVRTIFVAVLAIVGISALLAPNVSAGTFTLTDGNSSTLFETDSEGNQVNWLVDGEDQVFVQGFWYRVGSSGGESAVSTLPHPVEGVTDTNFDGNADTLFVRYNGGGFNIETRYSLDGGTPGSRASDLGEQIAIINTGTSPLDFHFFQYVDFDLMNSSEGDSAVFTNANAVRQFQGALRLSEAVITPPATHREINFYPNIIDRLDDLLPTTLSDTPGTGVVLGPGDMTWAFQWDVVIPGGGSFLISKDKNLTGVPEPATLVLISMAGLFLVLRRK
jgi:hypothetical protein